MALVLIAIVYEILNGRIAIEEDVLRVNLKYLTIPFVNMAASSNISEVTEKSIPNWKITGDWFDVCKCNVPCPCTFAQTPTYGDCDGVLAYHIKNGIYGQTLLDGLNVLVLSYFKGNIWDGQTKATISIFFDEKANEEQREALHMIFSWRSRWFYGRICKAHQRGPTK